MIHSDVPRTTHRLLLRTRSHLRLSAWRQKLRKSPKQGIAAFGRDGSVVWLGSESVLGAEKRGGMRFTS